MKLILYKGKVSTFKMLEHRFLLRQIRDVGVYFQLEWLISADYHISDGVINPDISYRKKIHR